MVVEFPKLAKPVIIAMKGLPCTGKSEIAMCLGMWARSPVLYIDHFLDTLSLEKAYNVECPPSLDEAERLQRLAFDGLCKTASDNLRWGHMSVIVKSRLFSTSDLDRLVLLGKERGCGMILIVDFNMRNEYRVQRRFEYKCTSGAQNEWYKPRSWKDMENAKDVDRDWDLHLHRLLENGHDMGAAPRVIRLVLDPFYDLYLDPKARLSTDGKIIIRYLLLSVEARKQPFKEEFLLEDRYEVVRFRKLGRHLREKQLRNADSKKRGMDICGIKEGVVRKCKFKYCEQLQDDDEGDSYYCGVCQEQVVLGQPAYTCYFCILTLHKSCAEMPSDVIFEGFENVEFLRRYPRCLPSTHACKVGGDKGYSSNCMSCLFEVHMKGGVLPMILNHDCHEHFLYMVFTDLHTCEACGTDREATGSYSCYICLVYYDIECISLRREVDQHEHGGHEHVLKLIYSRDGMEEEESYWCDICYEDIDPQNWFYSCQNCPYYSAHPQCVRKTLIMYE